jgi:uncharacterized OsmC-like protein
VPAVEERIFHLKSHAVHEGETNDQLSLALEMETENGWEPVAVGVEMPPYRAFLCAALMCQQAYLRMNATERGLGLREAHGELRVVTEDWFVRELSAHFRVTIRSGTPTSEDLAFISERMRDCPVSRNLERTSKTTTLEVVSA